MQLSTYIRFLRRWAWLIGLAAIIGGAFSFNVARSRPLVYQTSVMIQIGSYMNTPNPNLGTIYAGQSLADTYAQIVTTHAILQATVDKLNLPFSADGLRGMIRVSTKENTSLLIVSVSYSDPTFSADIANELANQLIANSPTTLNKAQQAQSALLTDEINRAQSQLQQLRDELAVIEKGLQTETDSQRLAVLKARQTEIVTQINLAQSNLAHMSDAVATLAQQGSANKLLIVDPARIPTGPIGQQSALVSILIAVFASMGLAAGVGTAIEYLRDMIRSPSDVTALCNQHPIGLIAPFGKRRAYSDKLITWSQPRSTVSEAYRALRVSLMYADKDQGDELRCRKYIVTSPGPEEGKSVTAANLAIAFAQTGMRVLLVDADLRRPMVHQLFNVPNTSGLSSLWEKAGHWKHAAKPNPNSAEEGAELALQSTAIRQRVTQAIPRAIQKTAIPGLDVMTSGPIPSNPSELLGSSPMMELVDQLQTSTNYDVVLFDTPPILVVADATIVSNTAQAGLILVLQAGRTRRGSLTRVVELITNLSIPLLGVVLNRVNPRDLDGGYGQYSYYGYYGNEEPAPSTLEKSISENGHS